MSQVSVYERCCDKRCPGSHTYVTKTKNQHRKQGNKCVLHFFDAVLDKLLFIVIVVYCFKILCTKKILILCNVSC